MTRASSRNMGKLFTNIKLSTKNANEYQKSEKAKVGSFKAVILNIKGLNFNIIIITIIVITSPVAIYFLAVIR